MTSHGEIRSATDLQKGDGVDRIHRECGAELLTVPQVLDRGATATDLVRRGDAGRQGEQHSRGRAAGSAGRIAGQGRGGQYRADRGQGGGGVLQPQFLATGRPDGGRLEQAERGELTTLPKEDIKKFLGV